MCSFTETVGGPPPLVRRLPSSLHRRLRLLRRSSVQPARGYGPPPCRSGTASSAHLAVARTAQRRAGQGGGGGEDGGGEADGAGQAHGAGDRLRAGRGAVAEVGAFLDAVAVAVAAAEADAEGAGEGGLEPAGVGA